MSNCFKRAADPPDGATGGASKRPRAQAPGSLRAEARGSTAKPSVGGDPSTIVTWNANGLGTRLNKDWQELQDFLLAVKPDLFCIQEVRFAAAGPPKCKKDDDRGRERGQLKAETTTDKKDCNLLQDKLKALADRLGYRLVLSLANYKYAGTAVLIRDTCAVRNIYYSFTPGGLSKEHNTEGRVIALELPSITVVMLYVPNNGKREQSFRRRREWDHHLRVFVESYDRPLVIAGDLNVAHEDADLTHPTFFKTMNPASDPQNSGLSGCTPAERERHSQLLESRAGLVDAFRLLYPVASLSDDGNEVGGKGGEGDAGFGTDTEEMTWRGSPGKDVPENGMFYGKGMRVDLFLLSKSIAHLVSEVRVFGSGADRKGFLGSDHSPLMLTLRKPSKEQEEARLSRGSSAACGQSKQDRGEEGDHKREISGSDKAGQGGTDAG